MITPETKKLLEELNRNNYGKALREYLDAELAEIKNICNAKTLKEMEGRQHAVKLIEKLFSFMEERKASQRGPNQYV